jgi:DNA-binding phage protein
VVGWTIAVQAIQQIGNGEVIMNNTSRPHDEAVVELLREDSAFADEYLAAAMEEANQDGGYEALLAALRHVAAAQV